MPTYRIQAYDTDQQPPEWRNVIYILDSEVGYAWAFETPMTPAGVLHEPLEEVMGLVADLITASPARMRVIETETDHVAWQAYGT